MRMAGVTGTARVTAVEPVNSASRSRARFTSTFTLEETSAVNSGGLGFTPLTPCRAMETSRRRVRSEGRR